MVIERKSLGNHRLTLWVAVVLLLTGCGGDAPKKTLDQEKQTPRDLGGHPPTATELNGLWLQVEDANSLGLLVSFNPFGMFAMDASGDLPSDPAVHGSFDVDDGALTFTSNGSDLCTKGISWAWQAGVPEDGVLRVVQTREASDECEIPLPNEGTLIRLAPRVVGVFPDNPAPGKAEGPVPSDGELTGIWLTVERPGLMVWFGQDGTFVIDDGGLLVPTAFPDVRGTHSLDGNTITFTLGSGGACSQGSFSWKARLLEDGLLRIIHSKEGLGNCRVSRGTEWTLVRVSPSSAASAEITP